MPCLVNRNFRAALALFCVSNICAYAQSVPSQAGAKAQHDATAQAAPQQFSRLRATLAGHTGDIIEISFSPDGSLVASGAEDGTVRLWDARTGAAKSVLKLSKGLTEVSVVWSPDGSMLLTNWFADLSTSQSHVQVWDARTGQALAALAGHRWGVNTYQWSPDGRHILTSSEDGTARVWDAATGAQLKEIVFEQVNTDKYTDSLLKDVFTRKKLPELLSVTAGYAAGGRSIIVSSFVRPPRLYTADGKEIGPLLVTPRVAPRTTMSGKADCAVAYYDYPAASPDGRLLVSGDGDNVRVWDATTGERSYTITGAGRDYRFTPDGRTLITVRYDPAAKIFADDAASLALWDLATGRLVRSIDRLPAPVSTYLSPDGSKLVLIGYAKAKTRVVDLAAGRVVARLPWEGCTPDSLFGDGGCDPFVFNADSRLTLKLKGELQLFSTEDGALVATLPDTNRRAAFHPTDPRLIAARSRDKRSIHLLELALK